MESLYNRVAIITGAAGGLGACIACLFAREGATVVLMDINMKVISNEACRLKKEGLIAFALKVDVSEETSVKKAFDYVAENFGAPDILVNSAGIDSLSDVESMSTELWDKMIRINLKSVFLCTRSVLPFMRKKGFGRIINISSQLAHKGAFKMAHYAASKAGIIGFTRSLAYELAGTNITVNVICPGPLNTDMFLSLPEEWRNDKLGDLVLGRAGKPEEVAPTALLLAKDDSAFYIGATFNPNGGDVMI